MDASSPDLRMGMELTLLTKELYCGSLSGQSSYARLLGRRSVLDAFQNQGNSLAHTDAHSAERIFSICP